MSLLLIPDAIPRNSAGFPRDFDVSRLLRALLELAGVRGFRCGSMFKLCRRCFYLFSVFSRVLYAPEFLRRCTVFVALDSEQASSLRKVFGRLVYYMADVMLLNSIHFFLLCFYHCHFHFDCSAHMVNFN